MPKFQHIQVGFESLISEGMEFSARKQHGKVALYPSYKIQTKTSITCMTNKVVNSKLNEEVTAVVIV